MRRLFLLVSLLTLLTAGCTGGDEPDTSSGPSRPPTDPVVAKIAALPSVDLDDLADPQPAKGFTAADTTPYAERVVRLMRSSVLDERWWDADPDLATSRTFLASLQPETRDQYLAAARKRNGSIPSSQYLVSIFDDASQPVRAPKVVKAAWRTERGTRPDGSAFQRVALQVFVLYEVGDPDDATGDRARPQTVLLQRWLQLSGSQPGAQGSWPSFANYSVVRGIDPCTLYEDGRYEARDGGRADATSFREFLQAAQQKGWTDFGLSDPEDDKPQEKQRSACEGRATS